MTNSIYTLSSIKRESSPVPGSDYMDINSDEAEAGSILLSLSKQDKKTPSTTAINTMSIRNLLGDNDDEQQRSTFTTRDQHQMNEAHTYATTSKEMHRYPETAQKKSTSFFDKRSQYHQHGMHVPCTSTTTTSPLISAPSESSHPPTYSQQS